VNLSDLLHAQVLDADGTNIGSVDDVQLVQDGPMLLPFGAAFRVDGLAVGHRAIGRRLGYHHGGVERPWLIRAILRALGRGSHYVDWNDVVEWDGDFVRISKRRDELSKLTP
jgi:hypothetical protein